MGIKGRRHQKQTKKTEQVTADLGFQDEASEKIGYECKVGLWYTNSKLSKNVVLGHEYAVISSLRNLFSGYICSGLFFEYFCMKNSTSTYDLSISDNPKLYANQPQALRLTNIMASTTPITITRDQHA
jgi:hypothetical protein